MSEQLPDVYLQSDVINHVVHSVNPNKTRRTVHCSMSFYEPNVDQRNDTRYTPHSKLQEAEDKYQQDLIAEKCRHSDNVEAVREHFQSKLDEAEKHIRCLKHNLEVCHEHLAKRDQKIIELRGKLDGGKTADDILKGLGSTTNE